MIGTYSIEYRLMDFPDLPVDLSDFTGYPTGFARYSEYIQKWREEGYRLNEEYK